MKAGNQEGMEAVKEAFEKRRRYLRVPFKLTLELLDGALTAHLVDASPSGFCFEAPQELSEGKRDVFRMKLADGNSILGRLSILWRAPAASSGVWRYGAKVVFAGASPDA